jgi:hypothetical protein
LSARHTQGRASARKCRQGQGNAKPDRQRSAQSSLQFRFFEIRSETAKDQSKSLLQQKGLGIESERL